MQINLSFDTTNMTKKELLSAKHELQTALSQVNHQLKTIARAEHRHFGVTSYNRTSGYKEPH